MSRVKTIMSSILCRCLVLGIFAMILFAAIFVGPVHSAIVFSDDFETGLSQWTTNGPGDSGTSSQTFQSANNSLYLRDRWVRVTSDSVNTLSGPSVRLSFWLRRGADNFSEDPDSGEDLVVYYRDDANAWVELEEFAGNGTPGEIFTRTYTLPADALHNNLRVRFEKVNGNNGNFDYWHIDDVEIETFTPGPTSTLVNYRFDEMFWNGAAAEVTDSSGNGYSATAQGGPDTEAISPALIGNPGTCGYGVFDGQGQYVEYPSASSFLGGLSAVTVMAWIRNTDTIGHDRGIFTTGSPNNNDNRFSLRYDASGASSGNSNLLKASINTSACNDNSDCLQVETESNLQTQNSWQHVAMTWESGDKIRIFIDGSEVQTTVTSSGIGVNNGTLDGIDFLRIGQGTKAGSPTPEWQGNIDEFRIYDSRLTEVQIAQAMNEAHPCTAPLAEYRFEGCDWTTGTVVADELGSYPGVVVQGAHTAPGSDYGGGLCNVANLANEGADYNRHISLDSNPIPLGGDWTLLMWINFPPEFDRHFSAGDYRYSVVAGGTNDLCWIRQNTNNGAMEWGSSSNPSAHRAAFPSLTGWHHLAFVGEGSTTSLYVDGVFENSVGYKQTGSYTRIGTSADDGFINTNRRQNLDTQLDELKFYVGALSASEINGIYTLENSGLRWNGAPLNCQPCVDIDHIRIEHMGIGLTCQSSTIDLRACSDPACTSEAITPVTVTMLPATANPPVWIGGDSYSFTGNQTVQLRQTVPGVVTLGISNVTPSLTNSYRCYDSGVVGDCDIDFFETGFIFDIPDLTACKQSLSVPIQAVRMDDTTQACTAADGFAGTTRDVGFWGSYVNPGSGTEQVEINGTVIGAAGPGTPISLNFDASATATMQVRYPDAGQMQVNSRYEGTGPDESGLVMLGNDSFVSRPVGLCVYSDDPNSECVAGGPTCSVFRKVDETFNLKVKGVCWEAAGDTDLCSGNSTTPNFQLGNIPVTQNLIAPSGGSAGSIGVSSIDITSSDNGEHVIANQTVSEVGVFTFTATPPDYFGEALPPATSANIGRFTPYRFETAIIDDGVLQDGCSGFTYTGQSFTYEPSGFPQMEITATNSGGGTTVNYRDGFVKLTDPALHITMPAVTSDASNLASDGSTLLNLTWTPGTSSLTANNDGTLAFTLGADQFVYIRESNSLVAPLTSDIRLSVTSIVDDDGITADDLTKYFVPAGTEIRYGRLRLQNAYGPETLPLTIPVYTEYYNGTAFILNDVDSCTPYSAGNVGLDNFLGNLASGETSPETSLPGGGTLAAGLGNDLFLSAPGVGNDGSVEVTLDLSQATGADMEWLQFDWDGNGSEDNPMARATFGIFKGNQDLIYMRESVW